MKKSDDNNSEFLENYRHNLFKTTKSNIFEATDAERKCISEMFKTSSNKSNTFTTCSLLDDMLTSYSNLIDDQNGINNYAEQLKPLTSNLNELQCSRWRSNLHNYDIRDFVAPLSCECDRIKPTEDDFNILFCDENLIRTNDNQNYTVQKHNILDSNVSTHNSNYNKTGGNIDNFQKHTNFSFNQNRTNNQNVSHGNNFQKQSNNFSFNQNKTNDLPVNNFQKQSNNFSYKQNKTNDPPVNNYQKQNFGYNENKINDQRNKPVYNKNVQESSNKFGMFKTAKDELRDQNVKKYGNSNGNSNQYHPSNGVQKKSLGIRRGVQSKFVPPTKIDPNEDEFASLPKYHMGGGGSQEEVQEVDERLKNIDPRMVELIRSEIMDSGTPIAWDDIAGLEFAKTAIKEAVVWPLLRPDIFTGLRRPPKGILLFGPPGTGKTLIGKCIASQSQSTFFSISASSLTSKWIGEGEKMVRAMFAVARCHQPAVIFIDEVDSLLSQRSDTEHESSRRIKTEFLVQLDGAATAEEDRILLVGATNRPQELDEAARRRFVKRLYIPLPEKNARLEIVQRLMSTERNNLSMADMDQVAEMADGFSGADMKNLCSEASLGPIRSIDISQIQNIEPSMVRPVTMQDFESALKRVRASVSPSDLDQYLIWDKTYGSGGV